MHFYLLCFPLPFLSFFLFNNIYFLYIQVSLSVTVLNVCELVLPLPLPSPGNQYFPSKTDLYETDNVE